MSSSKAPASWTTTPDIKLFAIRLSFTKATSMDIKYIILVTNSLGSARKVVDLFVHSEQAHFLAICVRNLLSELKHFFLVFYDFSLVFLFLLEWKIIDFILFLFLLFF